MIAEPPLVRQDLICQSEVHLASVCFIGIVHVPCGVYMVRDDPGDMPSVSQIFQATHVVPTDLG